jgi:hypothetical protein
MGKFFGQEIKDGVARVEIFSSRNESGGLMQHDRKRWSRVNEFAIDFDMVARGWLCTKICANFPIDGDAAGSDQPVATPTRTKAGSG